MISMIALYQKTNIKHDFQTRSKWIMHIHFYAQNTKQQNLNKIYMSILFRGLFLQSHALLKVRIYFQSLKIVLFEDTKFLKNWM